MVKIEKATIKGIIRHEKEEGKKPWVKLYVTWPISAGSTSYKVQGQACGFTFGDVDLDYKLNDVVNVVITKDGVQICKN